MNENSGWNKRYIFKNSSHEAYLKNLYFGFVLFSRKVIILVRCKQSENDGREVAIFTAGHLMLMKTKLVCLSW